MRTTRRPIRTGCISIQIRTQLRSQGLTPSTTSEKLFKLAETSTEYSWFYGFEYTAIFEDPLFTADGKAIYANPTYYGDYDELEYAYFDLVEGTYRTMGGDEVRDQISPSFSGFGESFLDLGWGSAYCWGESHYVFNYSRYNTDNFIDWEIGSLNDPERRTRPVLSGTADDRWEYQFVAVLSDGRVVFSAGPYGGYQYLDYNRQYFCTTPF